MCICLFLIVIIICILLSNEHFFHCLIIQFPKLIYFHKFSKNKNIIDFDYLIEHGFDKFLEKYTEFENVDKKIIVRNNFDNILDKKKLGKYNSISLTTNILTTPYDLLGQWKADTIFRMDFEDRGKDNALKKQYMSALTIDNNVEYRKMIKEYLSNVYSQELEGANVFHFCYKISLDLTYILHFGKLPDSKDIHYIDDFLDSLTNNFSGKDLIKKIGYIFRLKSKYDRIMFHINETINRKRPSIVTNWYKNGFTRENMYIEFIHNIIGMTVNWFNLCYKYIIGLSDGSIPFFDNTYDNDINPYLFEVMRYICPAKYISSSVKNKKINIIHNIFNMTRDNTQDGGNTHTFNVKRMSDYKAYMSRCPFSSNSSNSKINKPHQGLYKTEQETLVPCGFSVYQKENYYNFGKGYRRCPGELLSMTFLEELITIINLNRSKINIKLDKSIKKPFLFSIIETNFTFIN